MASSLTSLSSSKTPSSWPSWFSSGSIYSISASSSSSSKKSVNLQGDYFADLVKNTPYGSFLKMEFDFEIRLVNTQLHWFLLFKISGTEHIISMEITTSTFTDLVPTVEIFEDETKIPNSIEVATLKLKLCDIAELADKVVKEMETYNLIVRNCQHFCNRLLVKMGQHTYTTTIGPDVQIDDDVDSVSQRIGTFGDMLVMPKVMGKTIASMLNALLVTR